MNKNRIRFIFSLIVLISILFACADPNSNPQEEKDREVKAFNNAISGKELESLEVGKQVAVYVAVSYGDSGTNLTNYLNENIKKYPDCRIVSIATGKTGSHGSVGSYVVVWEKIKIN
jgi:hypothetical protein